MTKNSHLFFIPSSPVFVCEESFTNCSNQGVCNDQKDACDCFKGFTTYYEDKDYEQYFKIRCNYKQKNGITTMAFAFFVSFGSLYFYLGRYIVGTFQLVTFLGIIITNILIAIRVSYTHLNEISESDKKIYRKSINQLFIGFCNSLFICIWYTYDIIYTVFCKKYDGSGVEVY